jgi:hypothetical protein
LPRGAALSGHAGNRHGPGFTRWWTTRGWSPQAPKADPRRKKLPRPKTAFADEEALALPSGELVVVRYDAEIESFVFPKNGSPTRSVVPTTAGLFHTLLGTKADDLYLCESNQGVQHFDGKAWAPVETDRVPTSCALTADGTLWLVVDTYASQPATVLARRGGEWTEVPLPDGATPTRIAAAANRVWVTAYSEHPPATRAYSSEPVSTPLRFGENELPGPVWIDGITGLDVTTVDVVSVSAHPAGPGTTACTSLVAWLGPELTPEIERAIGTPRPRVVECAGTEPGKVALIAGSGAHMTVVPSGKKRRAVAVLPKSHAEGLELVKRVPGARLVCATPRIVREL